MMGKRAVQLPGSGTALWPPVKEENMKRTVAEVAVLAVAAGMAMARMAKAAPGPAGTIGCSGAWALYPMAVRWGEEFQKLHANVRFDVSAGGAGKGMTDVLAGVVDIGLVSREVNTAEVARGAFAIAVTKDAVVPVVSAANPVLDALRQRGVRREVLAAIWTRKDVGTWGGVAGNDATASVRVFTRSDACGAAETWAKYLGGKKQEDLQGIGVYGDPGLAEAVRRDPLAIGYNNVNFAYDAKTGQPLAGLAILPLDVNGNGRLDEEEAVYATQKDLVAAIVRGAYPSPPARDLYFVTRGKPVRPLVLAFIRWVLTDGQKFVAESGYIGIPAEQLEKGLKALSAAPAGLTEQVRRSYAP